MTDVEKIEAVSQTEGNPPPGMRHVHIDPVVQKRVVRKLDLNLMPIVVALCKSHCALDIHQMRLIGLTHSQRPYVCP
jgi:hypothetical protein